MYKLRLSRREKKKLLRARWLILALTVFVVALMVWLVWIRPVQRASQISSFEQCASAGYPIQESYPEVCLTKDGKRFVNPQQDAAHQASLDDEQELVPPSNPALLVLDIEEWGIRVPLTMDTFDLTYAYVENGSEEYVLFTYKRLLNMGVCKGDIGLTLTRSLVQNKPPYSVRRPAATAQAGKAYFYAEYADKSCYDAKNAEQSQLVNEIAGDKTLIQATTSLLTKLAATPKE
jgi:hypothetical protein